MDFDMHLVSPRYPFSYHVSRFLESVSSLLSGNLRCLSFISHQSLPSNCVTAASVQSVDSTSQSTTSFLYI